MLVFKHDTHDAPAGETHMVAVSADNVSYRLIRSAGQFEMLKDWEPMGTYDTEDAAIDAAAADDKTRNPDPEPEQEAPAED